MEKMGTGTFESLEAARKYFEGDLYATESGIRIDELKDGSAVCSFEITEHHRNADGGVMGGAIFTLIDFSFAVASSSGDPSVIHLFHALNEALESLSFMVSSLKT